MIARLTARFTTKARVVLRLSGRSVRQSASRSALILALISLPIIGIAGLSTVIASTIPNTQESLDNQLGENSASFTIVSPPDATLTQSPNDPSDIEYATNANGDPTEHTGHDSLMAPHEIVPNSPLLAVQTAAATITFRDKPVATTLVLGEVWHRSFAGKYRLVAGHIPDSDAEVLVSPALLKVTHEKVGGRLKLTAPAHRTVRIVGTLIDREQPATAQEVFGRLGSFLGDVNIGQATFYIPKTTVTWPMIQRMNRLGATVLSRYVVAHPPVSSRIPVQDLNTSFAELDEIAPIAAFSLFEVVLLAGAAFAVGARRQQRDLAALALLGADRSVLFAVVSTTGLLLGVVGGVLGDLIGVAGACIYMRATADGSSTQYPGFHPDILVLVGAVALALFAAWIASAIPARNASRVDVMGALRGARRPRAISRRRPIYAVGTFLLGAGTTLIGAIVSAIHSKNGLQDPGSSTLGLVLFATGPLIMQVGLALGVETLLQSASTALRAFGLAPKLASRDAARNGGRSVAAIAAIMTTVFLGSFIMSFAMSTESQSSATWDYWTTPGTAEVDLTKVGSISDIQATQLRTSVASILGSDQASTVDASITDPSLAAKSKTLAVRPRLNPTKECPQGTNYNSQRDPATCGRPPYLMDQNIWVGNVTDLTQILGAPVTAEARSVLNRGGLVSLYPQYVRSGRAVVQWFSGTQTKVGASDPPNPSDTAKPVRSVTVPAVVAKPDHNYHFAVFILASTARSLGIATVPGAVLAKSSGPLTTLQSNELTGLTTASSFPMIVHYESGPRTDSDTQSWELAALCAVLAFGAASVAIGLSRAEGRNDEFLLLTLGASHSLRTFIAIWQALLLAGIGSITGMVLGVIPVLALSVAAPADQQFPFSPPLPQLLVLGVGIPILTALGSALFLRRGGQSRPEVDAS